MEPIEGEIVPFGLPVPGPGRNTKYRPEFNEQARKLCLLGFTDEELAGFFGVCEATINNWKREFPAFLASVMEGKVIADANVADSLYRRANGEQIIVERLIKKGEDHEVVKLTQYVPGETAAARLWLLNRRKRDWRDKVETEHSGKIYSVVERRIVRPGD